MFGGGGSTQAAEQQPADASLSSQGQETSYQNNSWGARSCDNDAKTFTKCLDENQGNMQICGWYLEQLVRASGSLGKDGEWLTSPLEGLSIRCQPVLDGCAWIGRCVYGGYWLKVKAKASALAATKLCTV